MQFYPQHCLQLAFKHLDAFSIPELGTFRRLRLGAVIDHQKKKIQPPEERFVLETGEELVGKAEDFFFRWFNIKIDTAKALVMDIAKFVKQGLDSNGQIVVEGVGKLLKSEGDDVEFISEQGLYGQAPDFFGLLAVDYTMGETTKPDLKKKESVARASTLANQTVVEPAKRRRRFPVGWFLFLLFLLLGAGAAYIWQEPLKKVLADMGIITNGNGGTTVIAVDSLAATNTVIDSATTPIDTVGKTALNVVEPKKDPKAEIKPIKKETPKVKTTPKVEPKPIVKTIERQPNVNGSALNSGKYGSRPQNGMYYLVISSDENPEEAMKTANDAKGKVLVPYLEKGFYKVSVFESSSKDKVIAKMVEFKTKYAKSWIYWPGMPVSGVGQ